MRLYRFFNKINTFLNIVYKIKVSYTINDVGIFALVHVLIINLTLLLIDVFDYLDIDTYRNPNDHSENKQNTHHVVMY